AAGAAAAGGQPVLLTDHTGPGPARAVLAVPLVSKDVVLGALCAAWDGARAWDEREAGLLTVLARPAAAALEHVRRLEELGRRQAEAEQALADLKAVQDRLVQAETLRALGELAGGAAHHLNNLLTIVVGRVQLLLRDPGSEPVRRPLEVIARAAKDGAEVVRRLQQFAGMRRVTRPCALDLNELVADVLELTRARWQDAARARNLAIEVDWRPGVIPVVEGEPAALREMLTNLVLNAVDAMPRGGEITVRTLREGPSVVLTLADTGTGMPDDVRRRAPEPFFTTKGVRSTGLGLSVSYGIVRRHGGEVALESAPGRGTTVTVRLPVPESPLPAPAPPAAAHRAAGPLRILLIDDEDDVRDALADMLASQGHAVITATGGAEGLARLDAEGPFDLVLTDLVMPGLTGWEVATGVKARQPRLPVGIVGGSGEARGARGARAAVDFLLDKPVTLQALDDALARLE
ncbi:MAG TPA: ATP-binding protein, partial [Methylomirabilota bacterium]|nr:ATP-binding protein [Methylomirabilota bacterium]